MMQSGEEDRGQFFKIFMLQQLGQLPGTDSCQILNQLVVGLHFAGSYLKENYAVPSPIIKEHLDKIS
jgi:hypothetical protein